MASVLIVSEIQKGSLRESSYELASFAQKLAAASGRDVKSLVMGSGAQGEAEALAGRGGGEVFLVDGDLFANYTADAVQKAVHAAIDKSGADVVLFSNTPSGWDVAPRVAAALDAAYVSDGFDVDADGDQLVFLRRVFNGKLDARMLPSTPVVATMQPGATAPFEESRAGSVTSLEVAVAADDCGTKFVEVKLAAAGGVDLSKADIIVSGGRSLGGSEKFEEVIRPLAEALGGAVGASRPVVDAGWMPHEYQVGSSGQIVSPKLYVACGISGAIQHLVGMKGSNFIIAINKDADAPIFEVADVGVVADLFEVCPALTSAVKQAKG